MWGPLKKLFGKQSTESREQPPASAPQPPPPPAQQGSSDIPSRWIGADENDWGIELADLRKFATGMISTSKDPSCATNAISWRGDNGRSFIGHSPANVIRIPCELSYAVEPGGLDGRWFCPSVMEEKWAIYHYDHRLYFIRSWTRTVAMVAHTERRGNEVVLTDIEADAQTIAGPAEHVTRVVDFLIKSHVLDADIPAPLADELPRDLQQITFHCFASYGRRAISASYADLRSHHVNRPIRIDSPLFLEIDARKTEAALARVKEAPREELEQPARYYGYTPLHGASILGYLDVIDALLARGVDVNRRSALGRTALHDASSYEPVNPQVIQRLLTAAADVHARDREGATPLHFSAQNGSAEAMKLLLAAGCAVDAVTDRGFSALHQAAECGRKDLVQLLLDSGADPSFANGEATALKLAEQRGQQEVVALLRERGARG